MKIYLFCGALAASAFFAMSMQLGIFEHRAVDLVSAPAPAPEKKPAPPRAKFPDALAPAAQAKPVECAAVFEAGERPHKLVFLKPDGAVHRWQETHAGYREDWAAERVEAIELVVVVGPSRSKVVGYQTYPNGAPPITRHQYDLEASLVEAKTGRVLAHQHFQNVPRPIRPVERWERTDIGAPVSYETVFRWASGIAQSGAPESSAPPIVIVTD